MLPNDSQAVPYARRTLSFLGIGAIVVLLLVCLRWTTNSRLARIGEMSAAHAADAAPNDKPGAVAERNDKTGSSAGPRNVRSAIEFLPRPSPEEERTLAALAIPIDVEFLDVPLEDCLTFIGEYPNLPKFRVFLDRATLTDEGVALDQPMSLMLKGLRLESVLNLLLRPMQLAFLVEDDVLMITTAAKASEKLITRTYLVGDLYHGRPDPRDEAAPKKARAAAPGPAAQLAAFQGFGPGQPAQKEKEKSPESDKEKEKDASPAKAGPKKPFTDLVAALTTTIEPDSWDELSGPGSYTYVSETRSLVIRQTWKIHRQILQLLRDLREAKGLQGGETK